MVGKCIGMEKLYVTPLPMDAALHTSFLMDKITAIAVVGHTATTVTAK